MTKLLLFFTAFLACQHITFAQNKEAVLFTNRDQIKSFHTIGDLEQLKKGELVKLYSDRVREIVTILPFLSLSNEPNVSIGDIGINEDSDHLKVLKKNKEATKAALAVTKLTIEEFVPYADTEKIIGTILYFEEIIKKMRIGINESY